MKCSYCSEPSAHSITREPPANPKHHAAQADERKYVLVHFCESHWARLVTFLDLSLRVS